MQFIVCVNNWYSLQYVAKKMLLKNIIGGTRNISEGCNLLGANFNHSLRKEGGGGGGRGGKPNNGRKLPYCSNVLSKCDVVGLL